MSFLFGSSCDLAISFSNEETLPKVRAVDANGKDVILPLFTANQAIAGSVGVLLNGKSLSHTGIKIELIGQIGS